MFDNNKISTEPASIENKERLYIEACIAYNNGEPIMSDFEFDMLEKSLAGSPVVQKTHDEIAGATIDSDTFSLRPVHSEDEIMLWIRQQPTNIFLASLKIDGVLAKVQTGKNLKAESRGRDDNNTWDYTKALSYILPPLEQQYFIRGEVFLPEEYLEYFRNKYDASIYKVSRSAAITVLRRPQDHTIEDIKKLKFMAYFIEGSYATKSEMFKHLQELGFETPDSRVVDFSGGRQVLDNLILSMSKTQHPTDGLVIEVNDLTIQSGADGKYLDTQIAAKVARWGMTHFTSIVQGVKFTPGKGHYGVVLEVVPVVMPDGITQRNINVFNIGAIIKNQIGMGTEILFERQSNGLCYFKGVVK